MQGEFIRLQNQEDQKKNLIKKKELHQKDFAKNMNQKGSTKGWLGNKNLFLKDKKIIQPITEPNKSFNKNK